MENTSLEAMLFGLKEVTKDTDAIEVKKEINRRLTQRSNLSGVVDEHEELVFIKETVSSVSASFNKRKKQALSDTEIILKINTKIDSFRSEHQLKMEGLLSSLARDIEEAVDNYGNELIRRLDPMVIKERFKKKEDFELWLTTLNNSYKETMEKTVDRKTQSAIKSYLVDVEDIFETALSYLGDRQVLVPVEDTFYGSLSNSRSIISLDIRNNIRELTSYNKGLYEASEELFNGIWEARKKYDAKKYATTGVATSVGAAVTGIGVAAALTAGAVLTAPCLIAGIAAALISSVFIINMSNDLGKALYSGSLEKDVKACIEEFKSELNRSNMDMQSHISSSIKRIFDNELKSIDVAFVDFRKAVYIDEDKLPLLESKIKEIESEVADI